MISLTVRVAVGAAFLFVAQWLLSPALTANQVTGLFLIVVAAKL